jgi:uncharacterized protein (DUF1501 family)
MLEFHTPTAAKAPGACSRRDFLKAGSLSAGAVGVTLADLGRTPAGQTAGEVNCILLFLVGGPSQLDTWDLKPNAPSTVRGPFRPTRTAVPGVELCEHFPRTARAARHFAVLRSVYHAEAPIHETGHQLLQTGRLARGGRENPHFGAALSHLRGPRPGGLPPFVVLPGPLGNTGVGVSHGQSAGRLGPRHDPFVLHADPERLLSGRDLLAPVDAAHRAHDAGRGGAGCDRLFSSAAKKAFDLGRETPATRARYGRTPFGQSCLLARRLVEHGVRLVTVNMFDTVFDRVTWDCHADGGALPATLDDYKDTLCPAFDAAYAALLEDLAQRGLLGSTLVLAMGEFGRTPHLNPRGGRDHWPGVWSVLFAGAGVRGGQVVGSSDRLAGEPKDRPTSAAELAATVYHALGVDAAPLVDAAPVRELFGG